MASTSSVTPFTDQQRRAITATDVSIALAAGAGCGKTFVLTQRFLACLDPVRPGGPLRLDQLTAITFTERAAREMRERIRAECTRRLLNAAEEHVDHWLRTIRELDSARVSTIHSFCGSLLRSHAVEAQLDPHFEVLDATASATLLFELIDEHLRDRLTNHDEAVLELVVEYGLRALREMVSRLLSERQGIDWNSWRNETADQLVARWVKFWRANTLPRVVAKVAESPAAAKILDCLSREIPSHVVMGERCQVLRDRLPRLAGMSDVVAALMELREAARVQGGGGKKAWPSEDVYNTFRDAATELRDSIDKALKFATFDAVAARRAAEVSLKLLAVTHGVAAAYQTRKNELAALDFDDLLIRGRELLTDPAQAGLRKRLAAQTKLLLVDEFQDTDPLQVELVRSLCDGHITDGKLFFVGDYKQSIYRFRGADPQVFRQLREEIPAQGRLPLTLNFRSQPGVIAFVNALFSQEMGPQYEPLQTHRPQVGPLPAVEFLWAVAPEAEVAGNDDEEAMAAEGAEFAGSFEEVGTPAERLRRREADWIARRIRAMLDSGEKLAWDKESDQPAARSIRPGDITLLFRALTNVEYYEEALRRYDIEYYLVGGHAFYAQQEIYDVVNLLRSLASPCDAVSLVGVLRSPMFGLLDETLYALARCPGGLYAKLMGFADSPARDEISRQQQSQVAFAAATLADLRAIKDRVPIARLLQKVIELTAYDAILLSEFLGERKLANLYKLVDQARQFDAAGIFTLTDFIAQLSQFVANQPDEPMAAMQSDSINAVRLMSIHQSKGLEFPVVFVVDVDRPRRASNNSVAFHPDMGPMARLRDCPGGYDLFVQAELDEDLAELGRLLYVAMTRAADYLVLSAGLKDLDETRGPWMDLLKRHFDIGAGKPLVTGHEEHPQPVCVRVTLEEPPLVGGQSKAAIRHDLQKVMHLAGELAKADNGQMPNLLARIPAESTARRQYSFSRLHGTLYRNPELGDSPIEETVERVGNASIDALGLGTLVHAVLAELAHRQDPHDLMQSLVQKHARRQLVDCNETIVAAGEMIDRMLKSPRWQAIHDASRDSNAKLYTELEFLLSWPPEGITPDSPYIQGYIDCLYQDERGQWHIVDYKTNQVLPGGLATVAEQYEMQMLVYTQAVEKILGVGPVEVVLHFLRTGEEHKFSWNSEARSRVVEAVEESLRRLRIAPKEPLLA